MARTASFAAAFLLLAALPANAQQAAPDTAPAPATASPGTTAPGTTAPGTTASGTTAPGASGGALPGAVPATPTLPGVVATTNNPNLSVATLRLESGTRVSKIIGAAVQNEAGERVGSVDDLIMTRDDKVAMAIISVGGFLGLGSKLVAVPWSQLRMEADRIVMPGATKDGLNGMPNFTYG